MTTRAETILAVLKEAGADRIFGLPSIHNLPLYEALRKDPCLRHVLCRQETTACHMADGYARASGRPGVVVASTGPGTGYLVPAVQEAFGSESPLLCITTNIPYESVGKGTGALHELEDQQGLFSTVTKARFSLRPGDDTGALTKRAVAAAMTKRQGPVYLEIPTDLLGAHPGTPPVEPPGTAVSPGASLPDLQGVVDRLRRARQPLLLAGVSALRAGLGPLLGRLAEALGAPLLTTAQAKGIVPEDSPWVFGNMARKGLVRDLIAACDLTLAIGTRLRNVDARRRGLSLPSLIHLDWEQRWVGKNYDTEASFDGNLPSMVETLVATLALEPKGEERRERIAAFQRRRLQEHRAIAEKEEALRYLEILRAALPRDGILVTDNTQLGYWSEYFYPAFCPGGLMPAKGSFILGFAFPAAIGVRMAFPEKKVVALMGDGGFLYCSQELATCVRHKAGFPLVVVNDGSFSIIGHLQRTAYKATFEQDLVNPDFVALARAYGLEATRADSPGTFEKALQKALGAGTLWLIELAASFPEPPYTRY